MKEVWARDNLQGTEMIEMNDTAWCMIYVFKYNRLYIMCSMTNCASFVGFISASATRDCHCFI